MRHTTRWSVLSLLGFLGIQQGQAEPPVCGADDMCIVGKATVVPEKDGRSSALTKLANLANTERCPAGPVDVTARSPDERRLVCSTANEAMQRLAVCGITLRRPLRVQIMGEVRHPFSGAIFGLFDTKQERVLVTQEANIPALVEGTRWAMLPQRDFYRSLIIHEVVHGVMHQNLKRPVSTHAAHEYPAYALQIESLSPSVRDMFLRSFDQRAIKVDTIFSDSILHFDPYFFAARAYEHFKASADGCSHLTGILEGEVSFIAPPM
jgi:hypothetical protein